MKDHTEGKNKFTHKAAAITLVTVAVLAGFALRMASFRNFASPDGGFLFYTVDAYDHLRRISLGLQIFPSIPALDYYVGYPIGTGQIWSPFYDYFLTVISLLSGGSRSAVETIGLLANPVFSSLATIMMFLLGRRFFKCSLAGAMAALVFSLSPAHVAYTLPMNFDHHVLEPMIVMMLISIPVLEKDGALRFRGILITAGVLLLALLMWRGSALYWGFVFAAIVFRTLFNKDSSLATGYARAFALAALCTSLLCLLTTWGKQNVFSYGIISWFHVILLFIAAAALLVIAYAISVRSYLVPCTLFIAGLTLLVLLTPLRALLSELISGISFLQRGDAWLTINSEQRGVFSSKPFWYSATYLTSAWLMTPVAAYLAARTWLKGNKLDPFMASLIIWSPLCLLGLIIRYSHVASVITSLAAAYLFVYFSGHYRQKVSKIWICLIIVASIICPSWPHLKSSSTVYLLPNLRYGLHGPDGLLTWIRKSTPPTSHYLHPLQRPEYGILADWDLGALLYQVAQRPSVATAFGWETHGLYQQAAFWSTSDPAKALQLAKESSVKYVVIRRNKVLSNDLAIAREGELKGIIATGTVTMGNPPETSVYESLLYRDGGGIERSGEQIPALGNYRLVYESSYLGDRQIPGNEVSYYKLFEVVPAARINGVCNPGERIGLEFHYLTSRGRKATYRDSYNCDATGKFVFPAPYATEKRQGDTIPAGSYKIIFNSGKTSQVSVTEEAVLSGTAIILSK